MRSHLREIHFACVVCSLIRFMRGETLYVVHRLVYDAFVLSFPSAGSKAICCMASGPWLCLLIACVLWYRIARKRRRVVMRETNTFYRMLVNSLIFPRRVCEASYLLWKLPALHWKPLFRSWLTRCQNWMHVVLKRCRRSLRTRARQWGIVSACLLVGQKKVNGKGLRLTK